MKVRKYLQLCLLGIIALVLTACAPKTFVQTMEPGWSTIELRDGLEFDDAWKQTVDLLAEKFDLEVISQDGGYVRSGWIHSWTGRMTDYYKVRAIVKFSPERDKVALKSDAQYYGKGFLGIGEGWQMGTDERLTQTVKTDLMGKVGRTTR